VALLAFAFALKALVIHQLNAAMVGRRTAVFATAGTGARKLESVQTNASNLVSNSNLATVLLGSVMLSAVWILIVFLKAEELGNVAAQAELIVLVVLMIINVTGIHAKKTLTVSRDIAARRKLELYQ
jgi:hypothetical protein